MNPQDTVMQLEAQQLPDQLFGKIMSALRKHLDVNLFNTQDAERYEKAQELGINISAINRCLSRSLWFPEKKQYTYLDLSEHIKRFGVSDFRLIESICGGFYFTTEGAKEAVKNAVANSGTKKTASERLEDLKKGITAIVADCIRSDRQFVSLYVEVDMFAESAAVTLDAEGKARITLTHKPYPAIKLDKKINDDWREHFPQFPEMLDLLAAARFAPDRKKAYLFLQAVSDFGKGLLFGKIGAFSTLGIVVEINEQELDAIVKGQPSGRTGSNFVRALILAINEPERITKKSFVLESAITVSTKHLIAQTVPLYTKIYTSADPIPGLSSDSGIDEQIANRFSYIRPESGPIDQRPLFLADPGYYAARVRDAIAAGLNSRIEAYQQAGSALASKQAADRLNKFHQKYGIAKSSGVIADHFDTIRTEFIAFAHHDIVQSVNGLPYEKVTDGIVLKCIAGWWRKFVIATTAASSGHEYNTLIRERENIIGKAASNRKSDGFVKGVLIPHLPSTVEGRMSRRAAND
ncbi:hypothetical protein MUU47_00380 [Scandinavium sp. H11S7]|uniref:Uncharacterized protein n=1 Tax=Scandinavium hiltneri TaxID=2926519 RepID=A0ABT2DVQ4_9ENTR|nr:hypothetical protein [Scandinavium hiltneri]MCS2159620.1 hypothetical protein [Scandinavium hiltneri]